MFDDELSTTLLLLLAILPAVYVVGVSLLFLLYRPGDALIKLAVFVWPFRQESDLVLTKIDGAKDAPDAL